MFKVFFITLLSLVESKVVVLTYENTEDVLKNSEKKFVKFYAPWCSHCTAMQQNWTFIEDEYNNSSEITIASLDCKEYEDLCMKENIKGFPTLRTYWKNTQEDFTGERTIEGFRKFLKKVYPPCQIDKLNYCDDKELELIKEFRTLSPEKLKNDIDMMNTTINDVIKKHDEMVEEFDRLDTESRERITAIKEQLDPKIHIMQLLLPKNDNTYDDIDIEDHDEEEEKDEL